ncbi:hypothetical protein FEM48_ZijujUnG0079400 [Ziziphus jujuba var. spinosa]|uniref:Uncharacterized protein n=1 Tax=Ziziphus jujuba var. spinosa TaxID=714518 RepID=A0A978U8Q3_ZIZJJ|nr:hypothetical protein FEM48_ZijujUnG0079400 [Ziziphus jujuba var. spinosa]
MTVMQSMHLWRNCSRLLGKAIQFLQTALGILKGASTITKIKATTISSQAGGDQRQKRSREGFAVASFDTSTTLWRSKKQDPSFMVSIFTVFIIKCICTLIGKD